MNAETRRRVRERAGDRCEYCGLSQEDSPLAALHVEHIIPRAHGGTDDFQNLALACIDCNLHKGPNLTGINREATGSRLPHEAGLKLLSVPRAPKESPVTALIRNAHGVAEWMLFLNE